jgi:hypothetical protein
MAELVRLQWQKDLSGYRLEKQKNRHRPANELTYGRAILSGVRSSGVYIVPCGGPTKTYVLEGTHNLIILDLANIASPRPTPESALAFANKWGLPTNPKAGVRLRDIYSMANNAQRAVVLVSRRDLPPTRSVERALELEQVLQNWKLDLQGRYARLQGDSIPRAFLEPTTLLRFCYAEFFQLLVGGIRIRTCPRCGTFIAMGLLKGQQPIYCSSKCRQGMHRRRKRAVLRARNGS